MVDIQPADPGARRAAIWIVAVALVAGGCAILLFEYFYVDIQLWLQQNIDYLIRNDHVVFLAALTFAPPLLAVGAYLLVLGSRIVRSQRFPPPNCAVIRDTRVISGPAAVRWGRVVQILSMLTLFAASATPFLVRALFRALAVTA